MTPEERFAAFYSAEAAFSGVLGRPPQNTARATQAGLPSLFEETSRLPYSSPEFERMRGAEPISRDVAEAFAPGRVGQSVERCSCSRNKAPKKG